MRTPARSTARTMTGTTQDPGGQGALPARPRRQVRMLWVPDDPAVPVAVVTVGESSREISEALGGYLVDDLGVAAPPGGCPLTVYLPDHEEHPVHPVPPMPPGTSDSGDRPDHPARPVPSENPRAVALVTRLGLPDRRARARVRGPVLLAGADPCAGNDLDVPGEALDAAVGLGLLPGPVRQDGPSCPTCPGDPGPRDDPNRQNNLTR